MFGGGEKSISLLHEKCIIYCNSSACRGKEENQGQKHNLMHMHHLDIENWLDSPVSDLQTDGSKVTHRTTMV